MDGYDSLVAPNFFEILMFFPRGCHVVVRGPACSLDSLSFETFMSTKSSYDLTRETSICATLQ